MEPLDSDFLGFIPDPTPSLRYFICHHNNPDLDIMISTLQMWKLRLMKVKEPAKFSQPARREAQMRADISLLLLWSVTEVLYNI